MTQLVELLEELQINYIKTDVFDLEYLKSVNKIVIND